MKQKNTKLPSNKSFGIVFFAVFMIISVYPIFKNNDIIIWSLILSFVFLFLGISNSKLLTPLNKIWIKFGLILNKIISPIIMGVIFFGMVTPIGIFMKILGKDLLNLKFNNKETYWIKKNGPKSLMKNQF